MAKKRKDVADELRHHNQLSRKLREGFQYAGKVFEELPRGNGVSGNERDLVFHYWNETYSGSERAEKFYRSNGYTSRADSVANMRKVLTRYSNAALGHHDLAFAEINRLKLDGKDPSNDQEKLDEIYKNKGSPLANLAREIAERGELY